jgi:hypothetical protein
MGPHMICRTIQLTGYAGIRAVFVSVPLVPCLLDGVKFMLPGDVPRLEGTELRRAPRGPTLRSLVRLALKCDSAEEMGQQLKRRFDRSLRRQGIDSSRPRQAEAELDRLLAQD